jgi:beta-fructofuranosidase
LIHWRGVYHMFYQYNPNGPFHGTIHWGHASSTDLVHWTHLPVALAPSPAGPDAGGCWSGCAVDHDGVPTLIYSGYVRGTPGGFQLPCLATGDDELRTWTKYAGNPIIGAPPPDLDLIAFRDHSVWKEQDAWYQVIGSGIKDVGGTALLYRSENLCEWEYVHPLCVGDLRQTDPVWTGPMWECPDFFPLGDEHVLIVSVWEERNLYYPAYMIGRYADHHFTREREGVVDLGRSFYAPQSMFDERGRRIMWGWLREGRSPEAQRAAGWSGVMSLPRILSIAPNGALGMEPAPELEVLRGKQYRRSGIDLTPESSNVLSGIHGDALEIIAEWEPGDATDVGLKVRCSPDNAEVTLIVYDFVGKRLLMDRSRSSLSPDVTTDDAGGRLELEDGETLQLRVFLDGSVVELYANGHACLTTRIYPTRSDSLGIDAFVRGGSAKLKRLDVWEMGSIWTGES